jgi:methyltransferase
LHLAPARGVTAAEFILALVTAQRGAELVLSRRNTQRLMARGAAEVAPGQGVDPLALAAYLVLQGLRAWVMLTLGARWTTGIIVLPNEPLVARGPYRFIHHPNYVVVTGEIAVLPLMLGLYWLAALFTILNAAVLFIRIRAENRALQSSRAIPAQAVNQAAP